MTQYNLPPGVTATLKAYAYDNHISHSAPYRINGQPFRIDFRDGAKEPFYRPAEYRTTDPLIQQAIESSYDFGTNIRITRINPTCKYCINPLPPNFPRTPLPPVPTTVSETPEGCAPRSETPEGGVTGAEGGAPVGAGLAPALADALIGSLSPAIAGALANALIDAIEQMQRYLSPPPPHRSPSPPRMPRRIRRSLSRSLTRSLHATRSNPPATGAHSNPSLTGAPLPTRPPPPPLGGIPLPLRGAPLSQVHT